VRERAREIERDREYTPDGRWLVTASFDGTVAVVDVHDGHVRDQIYTTQGLKVNFVWVC